MTPAPASDFSVEKPLPPSIMPVVILQGSGYKMGWQYGQQAGELIAARKNLWWARGLEYFETRDATLHELKAYEYHIKQYTPELEDIMKGVADGASAAGYDVSYEDVLVINTATALKSRPGASYPPAEDCGHVHAWGSTTKDGSLVTSDNRDNAFTAQVALVYLPDEGNAFITCADTGQLACHPVMNNKGLFIGGSSAPARDEDRASYGVPRPYALAHMALTCDNAMQVKNWVTSHNTCWDFGINYSMSDVSGNAFVVETTPVRMFTREPGDFGEVDFIFATNNFLIEEAREAGVLCGSGSEPRNELVFDYLSNYQGQVDVEFLKMMYRTPGYPGIGNLTTNRVVIAQPDDGDGGLTHICTGHPCRGAPIMLEPWGISLPIHPTFSFYELALAGSPGKITSIAKKTAQTDLCLTVVELRKLNYGDVAYAPLAEIFSQTKSEWFKGIWAESDAKVASDDEALYLHAKATTHFTRCQALSRKVYDALVPPATTPKELGLIKKKELGPMKK